MRCAKACNPHKPRIHIPPADGCASRAAALCEDGREAWACTRHGGQSAAALAAAAGHSATDARVRARLAALAGALTTTSSHRN